MKYDIVVIGSGPGGYFAAIRAAQLGLKTACIEKSPRLGGTCLNVGCIPSKTLLYTTEQLEWIEKTSTQQGIECSSVKVNFEQLMQRKEEVVAGLTQGIAGLFKKNKIDRLEGTAQFIDLQTLTIGTNQRIEADHFIIATGSESIPLPFLPFDEKKVLSSTGALSLKNIPKKMLVIGAGVIGVELASVYRRLGTEIEIIEMLDRITPAMDTAVGRSLQQILTKQGIKFYLNSQVNKATVSDQVTLEVKTPDETKTFRGDVVLVAVGRRPYIQGLGLENIGVKTDKRGLISVDKRFRTSIPHIYAIGDVIDGPMLAHKAFREGMVVAEIVAGQNSKINYLAIPNVIYTMPEVAAVGLTESEAKELGLELKIGTSHFRGNSRARCTGEIEGFVKVIGDKATDRLMGIHIIGAHASELIAEAALGIELGTTLTRIAETTHAHPTLSEAIKEACLSALGRSIET